MKDDLLFIVEKVGLESVALNLNLSVPVLKGKIQRLDFTIAEVYGLKKILNFSNECLCVLVGI